MTGEEDIFVLFSIIASRASELRSGIKKKQKLLQRRIWPGLQQSGLCTAQSQWATMLIVLYL